MGRAVLLDMKHLLLEELRGESHSDFRMQSVIMTQITQPPTLYHMRHFQIFDKTNSFLKNV